MPGQERLDWGKQRGEEREFWTGSYQIDEEKGIKMMVKESGFVLSLSAN